MGLPALACMLVAAVLSVAAAHASSSEAAPDATLEASPSADSEVPDTVGFNEHIRPILVKHCVGCHGGPKQAGGVNFLHREGALSESDSGSPPILPGDPEGSYMLDRIMDPDDDFRMPPAEHGRRLTDREAALVRRWIEQGAVWQEAWALTPPHATEPPEVKLANWPRGDVDRFILSRLESEGLTPSPAADKMAWLRRVTFDLTGLPPTEEEKLAFESDNRPDAYQRVVDRLLASPQYGERWAAVWLDLARYADTMGYEKDPHRDSWPYRDWLIRALNDDMPFDEFTIKQLAGDLLPEASLEDRLATAFHRQTQTNTEGGTDDEEFRLAAVMDRVNTTWQVWMASTYGCAQCHDHPYDAYTQANYYEFTSFFNTSRDSDLHSDLPKLATPIDPSEYDRASKLDRQIAALEESLHGPLQRLAVNRDQWRSLTFDHLHSTGSTKLSFEGGQIVAGGTITNRSQYDIAGPAPVATSPITALRIDASPKDIEAAARNPELGFMLTRLRLTMTAPGAEPVEVGFATAFCDDPHPIYDPADSIRDNGSGWAVFSRIYGPRWAVFVLDQPLTPPEGARFEFVLKHDKHLDGQGAVVLRRARISVSTDKAWRPLATGEANGQEQQQLAALRQERAAIKSVGVPVMSERASGLGRRTFVFEGGNWLSKAAEVKPGAPASMPPLPMAGRDQGATRLEMAKWIASADNPLTSRTLVNRIWARLFGIGLVETEEDFGGAGEKPTHPELLDYLAVEFQTTDRWRLKRLLRRLVLSATYRQDARTSPELLARDPRNRLLARGPRLRLTAEMVRDQALRVSGKLSPKMYGAPVMPYQPDGIWQTIYSGAKWQTAEGEDRFRRGVYTYWRRTSAYPSMMTFDMPSREVCTVRRITTNTPLQALVTMNDPAYVELAQAFAGRIIDRFASRSSVELQQQLTWAYRQATGKRPHSTSLAVLADLHASALAQFAERPEVCAKLGDTPERFAMTVVANALLNLDDALTK